MKVIHYPSIVASRRCCFITGALTDEDRQAPHPEIALLTRLKMPCGVDAP